MFGPKPLVLILCSLSVAGSIFANPIDYLFTVNTSSLSGTSGSLDFNFNPGPLSSQSASLQILNLTSNGTFAGSAQVFGDVSGTLPGTLTFDNGAGLNDYFKGFTYGSSLSFDVKLAGPALSSPNGTSTSGSTFAFSMFSDPAGTVPALTSNTTDGFASKIDVNLDGSTTITNYSLATSIVPEIDADSSAGALALLAGVLLMMRGGRRKIA